MKKKESNRKARVTMKDVALRAGVSQSTVSFVLNGLEDMRISRDTRQRVVDAANTLGYRARSAGRPPKAVGRGMVGCLFDEIATSPFAAISIEGVQEEAWKHNVLVEIAMSGGDTDYESEILKKWAGENTIGVIYGSILTRETRPPDALARHRAVLLNCYERQSRYASVVPAERRGGEVATAALIAQGYRRIAFISGEAWMDASIQRTEGYRRALDAADVAIDSSIIVEGNFLPSGGRSATLKLMNHAHRPDAIFCANDLTAVGCYEALKELGIRPGEDIAVMGYDDQEIAQHLSPPLSTILLPHREMGQWCVNQLLGDGYSAEQYRISCPLVLRRSHLVEREATANH